MINTPNDSEHELLEVDLVLLEIPHYLLCQLELQETKSTQRGQQNSGNENT